ncbi:MAG: carboxylesterase family protein [Flavobacteriales bacterium]|nr:carboxylesterase family protein [Flavobacteriales bacterium]
MTGRSLTLPLLFLLSQAACTQNYVTPDQFAFRVDSNLVYGTAPNYLGVPVTLTLDLYKPIGNTDDARPLLVLVHGGSWLAGCKNDGNSGVVGLARAFARRGYVVASVNYRLGYQKAAYVPTPAGPPVWPGAYLSLYAADTLEMVRALYRAQQDVKGAIRWLKARADIDSTCADKTFVGGESAGGFNALAVGFLDRPEEKPASCGDLPDAPVPGANLLNQTGYACGLQTWTPTGTMLQRPDLGPVDGTLNLNGTDARVRGVVNLFGGVPTDAIALDWWQGVDTPSVYLFHQSCDGIVPFNVGRPYQTMSGYCNLGATPWHYTYPIILGSNAIEATFEAMPDPPNFTTDFISCDPFNSDIAVIDCIRYGNNGSYHAPGNLVQRAANIAAFLEPLASGPSNCSVTGIAEQSPPETRVFPQPATDQVQVIDPRLEGKVALRMIAMDGHMVAEKSIRDAHGSVEFTFGKEVPDGIYLLRFQADEGMGSVRVLLQR